MTPRGTTRRSLLATGATLTLLAPFARLASAAAKPDSRLVLVILRGGLDGLAAVPPYAEPEYAKLRGPIAIGRPGSDGGVLDLDGTFGLHPALTNLHALYRSGEALVVHAAATPYRDRSHFYAQNVLEAGSVDPSAANGGWLNRALAALHEAGAARDAHGAVALADSVPLVLRGDVAVASWAPSQLPVPDDDTLLRVRRLYEAAAPDLAQSLYDALEIRAIAGDPSEQRMDGRAGLRVAPLASAAARFLASPDGPRIAVLDAGGWDTHANQGGSSGPLAQRLRGLDLGLQTLQAELGTHWRETTVLVVTEFGRAAAVNGTRGTDHGTAGCAFAVGGAVAGGRVLADWPGLTARDLHDGRDLLPTTDLRALFKAVLHERFGVGEAALARSVFPASDAVEPLAGVTA